MVLIKDSNGVWHEAAGAADSPVWKGTQAEFDAAMSSLADGTLVVITDD